MKLATSEIEFKNHNDLPVLLIAGQDDKNVPYQVIQHTIQMWATRTILIGGGIGTHDLQVEPPTVNNYIPDIDRFLNECL